ncbi:Ovochymase-2 [Orchesella cincta]|uniref:Ovochymase-2 n=1 Tax=Orchesella cincta TaxID=48709 RepID=A0A1D2MA29_ORCCI|nr:Ovochymase-2 [Orchesella cincta]
MKFFIICIAAFAVAASAQKITILDNLSNEDLEQESRCGATIEADSGTLAVPAIGQNILPGSICIFTIHLQTKTNFRINISSLDISGGERDEDCSEAAVRIYSLTNLVPSDSIESYTFCNDNPPTDGDFFLSGNLATVIYQAPQNESENSGFTLNFEAVSFQAIRITHESSYTSATTGLIRYPVEGEYEINRVNTWLIKTSDANPDLELDVLLERIDMEECEANGNFSINEICLCDALIVYEIRNTGVLEERERLCGRSNDTLRIEYLGPNFLVAFFTDHIDVPGQGSGFQVIYKPHEAATTTTSTTSSPSSTSGETSSTSGSTAAPPTTTPRPPASNYSTECGGVLTGTHGLIEYKLDGYYNDLEKCLWTIRTPYRSQIRFTLNSAGLETNYDNIQINTFNSSGIQQSYAFYEPVASPESVVLDGTVATVLFQSDYSNVREGFSLSFEAEEGFDNSLLYYEDQNTVVNRDNNVTTRFPEIGLYRNLELSTISYMIENVNSGYLAMSLLSMNLETGTDGQCNDKIHIYHVKDPSSSPPHLNHVSRYTPVEGICLTTDIPIPETNVAQGFIVVLATNAQGRAEGVELEISNV